MALRAAHDYDAYHSVPRVLFCVNRGEPACNHAPLYFIFVWGGEGHGGAVGGHRVSSPFLYF